MKDLQDIAFEEGEPVTDEELDLAFESGALCVSRSKAMTRDEYEALFWDANKTRRKTKEEAAEQNVVMRP